MTDEQLELRAARTQLTLKKIGNEQLPTIVIPTPRGAIIDVVFSLEEFYAFMLQCIKIYNRAGQAARQGEKQ